MSPTPVKEKSTDITNSYSIIAENFLVLPGIARDLSAIVSGVIGIVKQKGGEVKEGPDESFIAEKDFQAAKKLKKPTQIVEETKKKKGGIGASIGGGIGSFAAALLSPKKLMANLAKFAKMAKNKFKKIMVNLGKNLMRFAKKIFSPKNIMKVLGKIALPVLIVSTLWVALSSAFEKWKETGSIWEAYKESVGSVIEFITMGIIDKETIKNLYQGAADFLMPVVPAIQEFFGKFSNWVGDKFSAVLKLFGINIKPKEAPKETPQKEEVVTPDILKGKEQAAPKEKDAQQKAADLLSKPVTLPAEPPPPKPEVQPAAPTPAPKAAAPTLETKKEAPTAQPANIPKEGGMVGLVTKAMEEQGITNNFAKVALLANIEKESGFVPKDENLAGYKNTSNDRIRKIFTTRATKFSDEELNEIKKDPVKFGEMAYGFDTKMGQGMGNKEPGDGFKYRGRGFIQITGKNNYDRFGKAIGENLTTSPEKANDPYNASKMAAAFVIAGLKNKINSFTTQQEANRGVTQTIGGGGLNLNVGIGADILSKVDNYSAKYSGSQIASASNSVAVGQRQQQKPTTPIIINKPTTNNTNVNTTQLASAPKDKTTGSNMVLARAT